jgi:hypothetical protein
MVHSCPAPPTVKFREQLVWANAPVIGPSTRMRFTSITTSNRPILRPHIQAPAMVIVIKLCVTCLWMNCITSCAACSSFVICNLLSNLCDVGQHKSMHGSDAHHSGGTRLFVLKHPSLVSQVLLDFLQWNNEAYHLSTRTFIRTNV